jgi:hypothetical protein
LVRSWYLWTFEGMFNTGIVGEYVKDFLLIFWDGDTTKHIWHACVDFLYAVNRSFFKKGLISSSLVVPSFPKRSEAKMYICEKIINSWWIPSLGAKSEVQCLTKITKIHLLPLKTKCEGYRKPFILAFMIHYELCVMYTSSHHLLTVINIS